MTDALREKLVSGPCARQRDQGDYVAGHVPVRLPAARGAFWWNPRASASRRWRRTCG